MTIKPEKADDDIDALEALESEEKEFTKVNRPRAISLQIMVTDIFPPL
jgi:hypothetical protein